VDDKGVLGVFDVTSGVFVIDGPGRRELPVRRSVVDDDDID
jgi:hypothetical protein